MRTVKALCVLTVWALSLADPPSVQADKLKGYIWDVDGEILVVEGMRVQLLPTTRIERGNHPGITAADLRIGWEVEVETDDELGAGEVNAKKLKVETKRNERVNLQGFVEDLDGGNLRVDGRRVLWPSGLAREGVAPGMELRGRGVLLDDGTVRLERHEIRPRGLDKGEKDFLALAAEELEKIKSGMVFYEDRLFQEYVNRVGQRLAPEWVHRDELRFNFSIVDDPDLNAFALPDGTIAIHTGLLAVLENEAQLATVLGHEIAHVTHKHGYRGYKRAQKLQWIALGAAIAGAAIDANAGRAPWEGPSLGRVLFELGAMLTLTAAVNGHGRNLEDDADRIGLHYALESGYDPYEAPQVWHIFDRHVRDQNTVANWFFSSHSTHRARISNLTREINLYYRDTVDASGLTRNQDEYERMVVRLRRHNAIADYERKEYRNAEAAFRRILDRDPDDAVAHLYLGKIVWDTGGAPAAEKALAAYRKAAALDPHLADPYREMGFLFYGLGDRTKAVEFFERYLEMAPEAPDAQEIRQYVRDLS